MNKNRLDYRYCFMCMFNRVFLYTHPHHIPFVSTINKKGNNLKTSLELVRLDMFQNKGIEVLDRLLISAFNQKLHI